MPQRAYHRSQHRFFDSLVAFTASVSSLGTAFHAQSSGNASGYSVTDYIALVGNPKVSGVEFHFFPHNTLSTLIGNGWPSTLTLDEHPINQAPPQHPLKLTGLQGVHGAMIASAFVQYFEANRALAETKYSKDTQRWPSVWNFGRIMRNALAHKGVIKIDNQNAPAVAWRSLSYAHSNNGKQVLYQDVTAVELVLLMEDMDAVL